MPTLLLDRLDELPSVECAALLLLRLLICSIELDYIKITCLLVLNLGYFLQSGGLSSSGYAAKFSPYEAPTGSTPGSKLVSCLHPLIYFDYSQQL